MIVMKEVFTIHQVKTDPNPINPWWRYCVPDNTVMWVVLRQEGEATPFSFVMVLNGAVPLL